MMNRYKHLLAQWRPLPHPNRLLWSLAIGLTTGSLGVVFALSYAALIFSGNLTGQLSTGFGLVLFSVATTRMIVALTSSYPGMVADLSTVPTAILAWSVGMVVRELPVGTSPGEVLVTVLATIALTSVLTGSVLLLLGLFQLGEWVRLMPRSVVGGFVASTGWLLVKGAIKLMTNQTLDWAHLPMLIQPQVFLHWLPGLLLALYLLWLSRYPLHPLAMITSLVAAIAVFYGLLSLSGISPNQAIVHGWTLPIANDQGVQTLWQSLSHLHLGLIHWPAIAKQWMCIATAIVTAAISLLMNVSGLELVTKRPIDLNQELKVAGATNLLLGLSGGILSFQSLSKSVLSHKLGNRDRFPTLADSGLCIILPLLGSSFLCYFPKPVLGGLLLFLGLSLLLEWVYAAWFKLSRVDYGIVQLIWMTSSTIGFLQGLTLGWLLAGGLLLFNSKRLLRQLGK
ncbi:SulP family inorganic anion transporter [Stenomitos frigidus]|nr:SulP family inorganic anion transporter [Stenomitos frigidus]